MKKGFSQKAKFFFLSMLIFFSGLSSASGLDLEACFYRAGQYYNINPLLLRAIAYVESRFNPHAVRENGDGSRDIGIMQINTVWLKELRRYGIKENDLYDPCLNIYVGAWILARCVKRYGYSWRAVGCYHVGYYHSGRKVRRARRYIRKVMYAVRVVKKKEKVD